MFPQWNLELLHHSFPDAWDMESLPAHINSLSCIINWPVMKNAPQTYTFWPVLTGLAAAFTHHVTTDITFRGLVSKLNDTETFRSVCSQLPINMSITSYGGGYVSSIPTWILGLHKCIILICSAVLRVSRNTVHTLSTTWLLQLTDLLNGQLLEASCGSGTGHNTPVFGHSLFSRLEIWSSRGSLS